VAVSAAACLKTMQAIPARGCVIIETKEYGLAALLPIGSIHYEDTVKV